MMTPSSIKSANKLLKPEKVVSNNVKASSIFNLSYSELKIAFAKTPTALVTIFLYLYSCLLASNLLLRQSKYNSSVFLIPLKPVGNVLSSLSLTVLHIKCKNKGLRRESQSPFMRRVFPPMSSGWPSSARSPAGNRRVRNGRRFPDSRPPVSSGPRRKTPAAERGNPCRWIRPSSAP